MNATPNLCPSRASVLEPVDGYFDFREASSFAASYMDTFYRDKPPTNDERAVFAFLVKHLHALQGQPVLLEVGCGPTIHHTLPFLPYVSEVHMADYLASNLDEVRKWQEGATGAYAWDRYAELVLTLEGRSAARTDIATLETSARSKIRRLLRCDLRQTMILGLDVTYPAVAAFYCTEEVGISMARWEDVMANLARVVAPGGRLFLSCLSDTGFYLVGETRYPCARITEDDLRRVLPLLGFDLEQSIIESAAIDGQTEEGVVAVVLVAATKRR